MMTDPHIRLNSGTLTHEQMSLLINQLGLELTYVDKDDICRFWTDVPNPIFLRTQEILGTHVLECHPEAVHDKIMNMLDEFRSGTRDTDSHWSSADSREGRRVLVTYRAIRSESGEYNGCVEIVQDLAGLPEIE
jgi:DUF438 domain-containing protein